MPLPVAATVQRVSAAGPACRADGSQQLPRRPYQFSVILQPFTLSHPHSLFAATRPRVPRRPYRHRVYRHFISTHRRDTLAPIVYIMSLQNANSIRIFGDAESSYPIPNPHPFPPKISMDLRKSYEWSCTSWGVRTPGPPDQLRPCM